MTDSPATLLRFEKIYRGFGKLQVLRNVSGEVLLGETMQVNGSNGSGKSTLLRCLAGLMVPERGDITCRVADEELGIERRRRAVGYVAPDVDFYGELTTGENLDFFCRLRSVDPAVGRRLLDEIGLPDDRAAGALSSGMKQRLRWAAALLHAPPILLLDEPLQNLDEPGRRGVKQLLERHLESGLAVVANPDRLEVGHVASHIDLDR